MQIRAATENDLDDLLEMSAALAENEGLVQGSLVTKAYLKRSLFGSDRIGKCFVLCEEKDLTTLGGMLIVQRMMDTASGADLLHVKDFYIRPAYRGQGFGRKFMEFARHYARSQLCVAIIIGAHQSNSQAIEFYEKLSGERLEGLDFYRWPVEDMA